MFESLPHGMSSSERDAARTPKVLRRVNAELVLDVLRASRPMRAADLAAETGLSRPTVNAVADELVDLGWVLECSPDPADKPKRGRPGRRLAFNARRGYVLALDVGEIQVRAAVADLRGDIVTERVRRFSDTSRGGTHRLASTRQIAGETMKAAGIATGSLLATTVGISGGVDPATGEILFSGVLPAGLNLRSALAGEHDRPVLVENDANLAALGERWRGVARGIDNVICALASERMGAGLLVNGQLVRGHGGAAGEMAVLGPFAQVTGAHGIAYYARTLGSEAIARQDPRHHAAPYPHGLWNLAGGDPARVDAEIVFAAAQAGDPLAADIIERAVTKPARAIATLALVLNPELVVIGGAVAKAGDLLLDPLARHLERLTRLPPRIEASTLAERGVLVGAVRHALDHVNPRLLDEPTQPSA